jgi:adenylate kinase family enzyme
MLGIIGCCLIGAVLYLCKITWFDSSKPKMPEIERGVNVYVTGQAGAGKSTIAKQLSEMYDMYHLPLDIHIFGENWVRRPYNEVRMDVFNLVERLKHEGKSFVLDSVYTDLSRDNIRQKIIDELIESNQIHHVVWLDVAFPVRLYRIIIRCIKRQLGYSKGVCPERLKDVFTLITRQFTQYLAKRDILVKAWNIWCDNGTSSDQIGSFITVRTLTFTS